MEGETATVPASTTEGDDIIDMSLSAVVGRCINKYAKRSQLAMDYDQIAGLFVYDGDGEDVGIKFEELKSLTLTDHPENKGHLWACTMETEGNIKRINRVATYSRKKIEAIQKAFKAFYGKRHQLFYFAVPNRPLVILTEDMDGEIGSLGAFIASKIED